MNYAKRGAIWGLIVGVVLNAPTILRLFLFLIFPVADFWFGVIVLMTIFSIVLFSAIGVVVGLVLKMVSSKNKIWFQAKPYWLKGLILSIVWATLSFSVFVLRSSFYKSGSIVLGQYISLLSPLGAPIDLIMSVLAGLLYKILPFSVAKMVLAPVYDMTIVLYSVSAFIFVIVGTLVGLAIGKIKNRSIKERIKYEN